MKLGFNEANDRFCKNHSVMMDLELCEKYGFDCIDIQSECLNRDLEAGKITLEEMGAWFQSHHLKMLSYNALCFFNMKQTQEEKDAVMAELDEIIRRCNILGCKMIVVVPSKDMKERGLTPTRKEIREDAVAVLKEMVKKCEPHGIRLSLEFCGEPSMTINRFEDAYAIVEAVDSPYVGVTLDPYHFYAMGSGWDTLEKADGSDPYEIFLSGPKSLLRIENPNAKTERRLIVFRDSFAASLVPLLAEGYSEITLVDIRYLSPTMLDKFIDLTAQDVLFLYSTSVLNDSSTIK